MSKKWNALCEKYKIFRHHTSEGYFQAGRLAAHLATKIVESCECPNDYVFHYRYEEGDIPEWDKSEKATSPWSSVLKTDEGWTVGLGLQLEIAANTFPKTVLVWPVRVKFLDNNVTEIESELFDERITLRDSSYEADLTRFGDTVYSGVSRTLEAWTKGERPNPSIGFHAQS